MITQIEPISVIFPLAEDQLPTVFQKMRAGQQLGVDAWDRENTQKLATGTLTTIDNQIDQTTGTVRMRADFDNKQQRALSQPVRERAPAGAGKNRRGAGEQRGSATFG